MPDIKSSIDAHILVRKASRLLHHAVNGTLTNVLKARWDSFHTAWHQRRAEQRWRDLQKSGRERTTKLERGLKLYVFPGDKLSELIVKGSFELDERILVRELLRQNDTFVDVGANIGLFTVSAAKVVGGLGRVFAFEPTESTYERLIKNVELNRLGNVCCVQMGLSSRAEHRSLNTSLDGYAAWNSFARPTSGASFGSEEVECIPWDEFSRQHRLAGSVSLMKIDVEGWELHVLNGAQDTLIRSDAPDLLVEFTEVNALAAGTTCANVYGRLLEFGYSMYGFNTTQKILWLDPLRQDYPYVNLLATKRLGWVVERLGYSLVEKPTHDHGLHEHQTRSAGGGSHAMS